MSTSNVLAQKRIASYRVINLSSLSAVVARRLSCWHPVLRAAWTCAWPHPDGRTGCTGEEIGTGSSSLHASVAMVVITSIKELKDTAHDCADQ
jgi:hypothetical protein